MSHLTSVLQSFRSLDRIKQLLCIAIVALSLWKIGLIIYWELFASYTDGATVFLAGGRGILNGLTLYQDLFDAKAPGIFYITAFSLLFPGETIVARLLQIAMHLVPVIGLTWLAWYEAKIKKCWFASLGLGCGTLLAIYGSRVSGTLIPDSFAAFGVSMFLLLFLSPLRQKAWYPIVAGLLFAYALAFREFTLFTLPAILLLFMRTREDLVRGFLLPLGIAAFLGLLILFTTGLFTPYWDLYLPFHLGNGGFLHHPNAAPLWQRALDFPQLLGIFWKASPAFAIFAVTLWGAQGIQALHDASKKRVFRLVYFCVPYVLMIGIATGGIAAYGARHTLFFAPLLVALTVLFLRSSDSSTLYQKVITPIITLLLLGGLVTFWPQTPSQDNERMLRAQAIAIDNILDACDIDRYMHIGLLDAMGYTQHSPTGPILFDGLIRSALAHPELQQEIITRAQEAKILFVSPRGKPLLQFDPASVTNVPPTCAEGITPPEGLQVLYPKVTIDNKESS